MTHTANRISRTVTVAVAGAAFGLVSTFAVANGSSPKEDPDSFHPDQRAAIARWANEHHMSGLSPASLRSSALTEYGWTPRLAADMQEIVEYARLHDLTGLSPASLRPIPD